MKGKVQVFQFGRFPKFEISFESIFLIKCYIITVLNFFLERSDWYVKSIKNNFSLYFQKLIWTEETSLFIEEKKCLKKPTT